MARIDEIAPDLYRVSVYAPQFDLQFNHFLTRDDEPLLFHTGMRRMFPEVRDAVAQLIDPGSGRLRASPQTPPQARRRPNSSAACTPPRARRAR